MAKKVDGSGLGDKKGDGFSSSFNRLQKDIKGKRTAGESAQDTILNKNVGTGKAMKHNFKDKK